MAGFIPLREFSNRRKYAVRREMDFRIHLFLIFLGTFCDTTTYDPQLACLGVKRMSC